MILIPNLFYKQLEPAVFKYRLHRFSATVETAGEEETVHIPNSGRLQELLFAGNKVGLHFEGHPRRKTRFSLVKAHTLAGWSYVDSRLPNRILTKYWSWLPPLRRYEAAIPEISFEAGRFDLGLQEKGLSAPTAFLEAKCVTLVQGKTGLFPDAPTERGRKHLQALTALAREGKRALVFFFLQHPAGEELKANQKTDPLFAALMARAHKGGVEFYAYRVTLNEETVELSAVPVMFS